MLTKSLILAMLAASLMIAADKEGDDLIKKFRKEIDAMHQNQQDAAMHGTKAQAYWNEMEDRCKRKGAIGMGWDFGTPSCVFKPVAVDPPGTSDRRQIR